MWQEVRNKHWGLEGKAFQSYKRLNCPCNHLPTFVNAKFSGNVVSCPPVCLPAIPKTKLVGDWLWSISFWSWYSSSPHEEYSTCFWQVHLHSSWIPSLLLCICACESFPPVRAFPSTSPVPSGIPCFLHPSNLCQCLSPPPAWLLPARIALWLAPRAPLTPQRQVLSSRTILPPATCSKTMEFHRSQLLQFLSVGWKLPAHPLFLFSFIFWHPFCEKVQSRKTPT